MKEHESIAGSITFGRRLVRGLIGMCLGWLVANVVCLVWCGIATIWAGDLEVALNNLKSRVPERLVMAIFSSLFAGMASGFLGSTLATLAMGHSYLRYPVVTSGLVGGGLSAFVTSIIVGVIMYWLFPERPSRVEHILIPAVALLPVTLLVGWTVGRKCTHRTATKSA